MKIGDTSALQPCKLQQIRSEKNISQRELAEAIGVSRNTINRIELGIVVPNLDTCKRICDYLGVTLDEVFG
ncbi:MAG: helix-turn-helix transcriptional regulator [Oscillospiraceae bacterium]|nr:helix-turn-helix transcriptional regulator [Oscillospiraceae bacterium]